jgi:predicted ATPase
MSSAMQIAERVYSLAQEQDDPALMLRAYNALTCTSFFLGDFESSRQYAMRGLQIWRSGSVQSSAEDFFSPAVYCLCYEAVSKWFLGEIASSQAKIVEAISLAKELKDMPALALALWYAAILAQCERNPAEVECYSSDLIELSTRYNFVYWLALGTIFRGWARSASGDPAEGIAWIEQGLRGTRATGTVLGLPHYVALKAEALHLVDRTAVALETINEAEALAERFENRYHCAELHRLRGVFLAAIGANEAQIEASFCEAIRIAKEQKSISLEKRAEATYAEYRRQNASESGGRGFRLPLW